MDKPPISRGFRSRRQEQTLKNRLPPGQYVTTDFPVLSAGPTPRIKLENWTFALQFGGSLLGTWNWAEFEALPQTTIQTDIHCVTKWSKLDTTWQGVTFDDLLKAVGLPEPPAPYIMAHCEGGYTTNIPVADLVGGKGMIATRYEGLPISDILQSGATEIIYTIVNGRTGQNEHERQGLNSALRGEGPSLDILANFTEISAGYSPMWDVQLAEWTKEAIKRNQRKLITDGDDVTAKSETGLLVSPGGGPVRTTGNLVNCPVVGFTNE